MIETRLKQSLQMWLTDHQQHLADFVKTLASDQVSPEFLFKEPVNAEYSPEFQMEILGLTPQTLMEPILDVGCGVQASLVRHLKTLGYNAVGMDRGDSDLSFVIQKTWPHADFSPQQWGTIVSHMAFSTHFLHHHLSPKGQIQAYARFYMQLLQALKPGARLIYAPGLPFIEQVLPKTCYHIQKRDIPDIPAMAIDLPWYTCTITKLG